MSRRESVGRVRMASQSDGAPPALQMVSCAVLPPRLAQGMAPPTGLGLFDSFGFDEVLNWQHNDPIDEPAGPTSRRKSLMRKAGLTTQRHRAHEEDDLPPCVMRQIPYDTWRRHYAKDKDGNYRGTHAPAADCLLKPDDVRKWRLGDPVTKADKWTRGTEVLPVYAEVREEGHVPEYQVDEDADPATSSIMTPDEDRLATHVERRHTVPSATADAPVPPPATDRQMLPTSRRSGPAATPAEPRGSIIADGKTAAEIIEDAKAKPTPKLTWKQQLHKGVQWASAGNF